jgi:beta-mannanase
MEPNGVQLRAIAVGRYDAYLQSFARAVRAFGQQVIVGFAPEMNGNWYGWGFGHTAAATWVTAWRHLVTTFRACGATNATWLWTVNSVNAASAPLRPWWPGASYVTWVGIDGYYYRPTDTFASVFGATLAQVRRFTAAPVLISETAVGPSSRQPAQIEDLFASARARHLQGVVWFDMAQRGSPYHLDWRLEDSPAGLAAFRRAARTGT